MGGAESVLLRLLEKSAWRSESVVISLGQGGALAPRMRGLGVPVHELGMNAALPNPFAVVSIARILRSHGADLVSTWMYHGDLIGGIAGRMAGLPVIWGIRNSTLSKAESAWTTRAIARVNGVLSGFVPVAIISCSQRARDVHVQLGFDARKFRLIPNGVDTEVFKPDTEARAAVRTELHVDAGAHLVGIIARFDPQKNHRAFLEAAGNAFSRRKDVRIVLAGVGMSGENGELMSWLRAAGLDKRTHLLGPRHDIHRIMTALDVLALPSSYGEAFPSVLAEAMACGVPCVTTDVGDAATIVGTTGTVVPIGDMPALIKGAVALLDEDAATQQHRATSSRARVVGMFNIDTMVAAYEQLFRDASARRAGAGV